MAIMKPASLFFFIVLSLSPCLQAERQIEFKLIPVSSKTGHADFAAALQQQLSTDIHSDHQLKLLNTSTATRHFELQVILRKDLRYPDALALFLTITHPDEKISYRTLLFNPEDIQRQHDVLVSQLCYHALRHFKSETLTELSSAKQTDMTDQVYTINLDAQKLDIELLGKTAIAPTWKQQALNSQAKQLPLAAKKQPEKGKVLLDFMQQPTPAERDPTKQEPEPPKAEPIALNPYKNPSKHASQPHHLFKFPRLQNGGLAALVLTPQLHELENKPGQRYSFETWSAITFENFENTTGTSTYKFDGSFLQQRFQVSTLLWQHINVALDSGLGLRDSDVQFDALHPSAAGGTTFIPSNSLDGGLLDSTFTLSWRTPIKSFSLRPVLKIKLPTGSEKNLLGSGHSDLSAGLMANIPLQAWTLGLAFHLIAPGEIGNFDPNQGDLPTQGASSIQIGLGRTLDYYGPLAFSVAYQYMQNPLRKLSSMPETAEDLHYLALLFERQLKSNWSVQTQASAGMSPSSANATLSVGLNYHH